MTSSSVPILPSPQQQQQFKLECNTEDITLETVLCEIQSFLYSYFGYSEAHKKSIDAIILQTVTKIPFDRIEWEGLLHDKSKSSADKFLGLVELIISVQRSDWSTIGTFLTLLVNLEGQAVLSQQIRNRILLKFRDSVRIIPSPIARPNHTEVHIEADETESISHSTNHLLSGQNQGDNIRHNINRNTPRSVTKRKAVIGYLPAFLPIIFTATMLGLSCILFLLNFGTVVTPKPTDTIQTIPTTDSIPMTTLPSDEDGNVQVLHLDVPARDMETVTITPRAQVALDPVPTSPLGASARKLKYKVEVSSYAEYCHLMRKIPNGRDVIVSISLEASIDWPSYDVVLPNSAEISKLSLDGPFSITAIVRILSQTPNIRHLHLKNTRNKLCARNEGQLNSVHSIRTSIHLTVLRTMVIQNFSSCPEVYEALGIVLEENIGVKGLAIYKGVVDDMNHIFIQQLAHKFRGSLRHLHLAETEIGVTVPLFEVGAGLQLPKVSLLQVDSMCTYGTDCSIPIGDKLSRAFQNLRTFTSDHGYIRWRNVSHILRYQNLTALQAGIQVPEERNTFNVAFLRKSLPLLGSANLTLHFVKCASEVVHRSRNEIVGWETVRDTLGSITIRSNCKMYANLTQVPLALKRLREEKYSKLNGMYQFTYTLVENRKKR